LQPSGRMQSRWTIVDGLRIHAHAGISSGPPLVMVHGLGVSSRYLLPAAQRLEPALTVFAPDLPGSGRSEKPAHALDIQELATALLRWMDAIGLERASFLGHSMGCQVVVELACAARDRVDRLVLIGPTVDPRWRSPMKQIPRWLLEATREPLSIMPILIRDYFIFGPLRFLRTGRFAIADRLEEKLPRMTAPTLVLRGERDAFVSQQWVERVAALLPNGRAGVVPNAAHAVPYSAPEALARLILPMFAVPVLERHPLRLAVER
jgi:2-hydroxy-6-oxonona-2,4-dienedioate hydrolase